MNEKNKWLENQMPCVELKPQRVRQPCSQGFSLRSWEGREKTLATAGHVTTRHPKNLGVINLQLHEVCLNYRSKMAETRGGLSVLSRLGIALNRCQKKFLKYP